MNKLVFGIIFLLVFLVGCETQGDALRLPPLSQPAGVRANSCDADKVCEMNNAQVGQVAITGNRITTTHPANQLRIDSQVEANVQMNIHPPTGLSGLSVFVNPSPGSGPFGASAIHASSTANNKDTVFQIDNEGSGPSLFIRGNTLTYSTSTVIDSKGKVGIGTLNPSAELDVVGTTKSNIVQTNTLYADAFKIGQSPGCNPALIYYGPGTGAPCGSDTVNVNSELKFTQFIGQGNAYACLDANGVLFRSNTPCT